MHTFTPEPRWKPLTERDPDPNPPQLAPDDPGRPLDFVLTPRERDKALLGTLALEDRRRRLNREDDARDLAVLLEQPREPAE